MRKINFKKAMAAVAALSMVACVAAIPASASAEGATVEITQIELSLDELAAMNYVVPITAELTENAGINAFAFGLSVNDRCTFEVNYDATTLIMSVEAAKSNTQNFAWVNGANTRTYSRTGTITGLDVTVPSDAQPGDVFEINYVDTSLEGNAHFWNDTTQGNKWVDAGTVDYVNGWIKIKEETTTTPEETTTTPEETTTTEDTTTTPEETTTTPEETTTAATTTAATTTAATTTTAKPGSTASPATGAADVLPIVGVAAAVAVVGGVAMVSKKKED